MAPAEAIELLRFGEVTELSPDHDLGLLDGEREVTGCDVGPGSSTPTRRRASWRPT